ncbi:MAG: hypothetical protein JWO32_2149 [Bacteroidetes bacterium]|nr:hypothetical protein [Bacteroidota bacterium]
MHKYLFLVIILFSQFTKAQTINDSSEIAFQKKRNWDTLKYQKFDYVLIVGLYQQHRSFNNEFQQIINKDTSGLSLHSYMAESQLISGVSINYDKFSLSFGTRSSPQSESSGKGYTKAFNVGLNIGDNRYLLENYYRRFVGFYNRNTPNFDSSFKRTGQYYLKPNLTSAMLMSRIMYFTNYNNFSFKSGFGCNYRQLKSAATWIVGASFSVYNFNNDSAILPLKARPLFNDYSEIQGFRSVNFAGNVGAAATIVLFKAWFISGYFTLGPEQQWRNYNLGDHYRNISVISVSGTGRLSLGLNLKRFYMLGSYTNDYNLFNSSAINFKSESITGNFTFGWRFHTGTPTFYRKFQQSKFYKLF